MTDRQFVRSIYKGANLQYHVMPRNTMSPRIWYSIISDDLLSHNWFEIAKGNYRSEAWRNAKKWIMKNVYNKS